MVTILNSPGGFGAQLGANLGTGVNAGLQYLLENKLKGLQSQKETENLIKQGVPSQIAHLLPSLDDQGKKALWDKFNFNNLLSANHAQSSGQQGGQVGNMMQALGGQQNQQQGLMQNQPNPVQSSMQNQPLNNMAAIPADIPQEILDNISKQLNIPVDAIKQLVQSQQQPSSQDPQPWFTTKGSNNGVFDDDFKRMKFEEEQALKREKFEEQKQSTINKKYEKRIQEYEKDYTIGSQLQTLVEDMERLNEEIGTDWSPMAESATEALRSGTRGFVDLRSKAGKAAEEFRNKADNFVNLSLNSVKGIPSKFRGQLLQASKPNLSQTYEARKNIINDALKYTKSLQIPYEETLKVLEENDGKIPEGFSSKVVPVIKEKQKMITSGIDENTYGNIKDAVSEAKKLGLKEFDLVNEETGITESFSVDANGNVRRIS